MTMTLDEAIEHADKVACSADSSCAQDHVQLARWLRELRALRASPAREPALLSETQALADAWDDQTSVWWPALLLKPDMEDFLLQFRRHLSNELVPRSVFYFRAKDGQHYRVTVEFLSEEELRQEGEAYPSASYRWIVREGWADKGGKERDEP